MCSFVKVLHTLTKVRVEEVSKLKQRYSAFSGVLTL